MARLEISALEDEIKEKIETKTLSKHELKEIEMTLKEDFPEYWKWRSKYNTFGMMAIVLAIILIGLMLVLLGVIPVVEISAGSESTQRLVFGLVIALVLFFITNVITAIFALKFLPYGHVKQLLKLMKKHYPQELVDFDIPTIMGINIKEKKAKKK